MSNYSTDAQDTTTSPARVPDWLWVRSDWKRLLAFGFGSGLAPRGPGTAGTLVAIPLYLLLDCFFPGIFIFALTVPLFGLGVWICNQVSEELGVSDHGGIVWDELVAFLMVLGIVLKPQFTALTTIVAIAVAFGLFRLFDIFKPFPIRRLERSIGGGLGVMVDDIFAAVYAIIAFELLAAALNLVT